MDSRHSIGTWICRGTDYLYSFTSDGEPLAIVRGCDAAENPSGGGAWLLRVLGWQQSQRFENFNDALSAGITAVWKLLDDLSAWRTPCPTAVGQWIVREDGRHIFTLTGDPLAIVLSRPECESPRSKWGVVIVGMDYSPDADPLYAYATLDYAKLAAFELLQARYRAVQVELRCEP